jgi:hypothetical protein
METPKAPETARGETTLIGTSIVIKGELSCGEDGCFTPRPPVEASLFSCANSVDRI